MKFDNTYYCDGGCGLQAPEPVGWEERHYEEVEDAFHYCPDCVAGHRELTGPEFVAGFRAAVDAVAEMAGHTYFNGDGRFTKAYWAMKLLDGRLEVVCGADGKVQTLKVREPD